MSKRRGKAVARKGSKTVAKKALKRGVAEGSAGAGKKGSPEPSQKGSGQKQGKRATKRKAKRATKDQVARELGVSVRTVTDMIQRLALKPDRQGRYACLSLLKEHKRRLEADSRKRPVGDGERPAICTWADVERERKVQRLDIEIARLRDELVPIDEVRNTLAEHAAAVTNGLDNFVAREAAESRNAERLRMAEDLRDMARQAIQEQIA